MINMKKILVPMVGSLCMAAGAVEYHVAKSGDDSNAGSADRPFLTIQMAADVAQPGDEVVVHEGIYRERIDPPRGGASDEQRIVYQAAKGEEVIISGAEVVKGWKAVGSGVWEVTLPNSFFKGFNPFNDLISGDWFNDKKRPHHTGAVYLNGHWLIESATKEWAPDSSQDRDDGNYLLNLASVQVGGQTIEVMAYAAQDGGKPAPAGDGGTCLGWLNHGDWVQFDQVNCGEGIEKISFRVASPTKGRIEIRLDSPSGKVLGETGLIRTGGWQAWESVTADIESLRGKNNICLVFKGEAKDGYWFADVEDSHTRIRAQFGDSDPNKELVEVNARQTVFYPTRPNLNYITVRGFKLTKAATPWAPPTAEQIGLIGTHWSKGWIIENNEISYSVCTGITLGKHGDEFDNTSQNSAEGYVETIKRAYEKHGWTRENIGSHVVRNNHVSHCEQAGLVGSLGCAFSTITDNTFHDIHVRKLFGGAEMACIKFHGAIDTLIARNQAYDSHLGMWLDWMTQGTRVTQNFFHDNDLDLWLEVNHGPFVVDNNLFLSSESLRIWSRSGTYAHNLFGGNLQFNHRIGRQTPYLKAHSTEVAGLSGLKPLGDDRYYNNIFLGGKGLVEYTEEQKPCFMAGNVFLHGARPSVYETGAVVLDSDPGMKLARSSEAVELSFVWDGRGAGGKRRLVTTEMLGKALVPQRQFYNYDQRPLQLDTDYFGKQRNVNNPTPGPFENPGSGRVKLKVW